MDVFRDSWLHQVKILTEAVDDITTIDDFLMVTGKLFIYVMVLSQYFLIYSICIQTLLVLIPFLFT